MRTIQMRNAGWVMIFISLTSTARAQDPASGESREFQFRYSATLADLPENAEVRVWMPIAKSNSQQTVELRNQQAPAKLQIQTETKYQNQIGYFEFRGKGAPATLTLEYHIHRRVAQLDSAEPLTTENRQRFLQPNSRVPIDGAPLKLIEGVKMPVDLMAQGKAIFEIVEQHMNYDKTKSGYGNGDVVWACDSQTGNCTDFHSVFIALARGLGLPAKFEMGFPIGVESEGSVGGYHCWAWFYVKHQGWMPVDISEADKHPLDRNNYFGRLDADRVAFSTGRDIELIPASRTAPLNYFIYPHVEVDGEVWPIEKIDLNFYYQNVNEDKN